MKNANNQANSAVKTATNTGSQLGAEAQGIGSTLTPFLTSELEHPQGYSQEDQSSMLAAGLGGAGGANSGLVGQANQQAAVSRNAGGFQAALDSAARSRQQAAAGTSEDIAAQDATVKQQQQQDAARGLQGMYGTDTSGMLGAMDQVPQDINAEVNANKTGWLQNAEGVIDTLSNAGNSVVGMKKAF